MAQWILKSNSQIVPWHSLRHLRTKELNNNVVEERKRLVFMENICVKLGDSMSLPVKTFSEDKVEYTPYEDEDGTIRSIPKNEAVDAAGNHLFQQLVTDTLTQVEVLLPHGEELLAARVIRRTLDENRKIMSKHSDNSILNTLMYDVEFPDGTVRPYAANVIADKIYAQVDLEGTQTNIIDTIIDHCTYGHAVLKNDQYLVTKRGRQHLRNTTAGWKLLIAMEDGSEQ